MAGRAGEQITLEEATKRLKAFEAGLDPFLQDRGHCASSLAEVLWPDNEFLNAQGAGRAASGILKRLKVPQRGRYSLYYIGVLWRPGE